MNTYRYFFVAFALVLVLPLWGAHAAAAGCPYEGPAPHQCSYADEATWGAVCSGPLAPSGEVVRFMLCHCDDVPVPASVTDMTRAGLVSSRGVSVVVTDPAPWMAAVALSASRAIQVAPSLGPPGAVYRLNCTFLI